MMNIAIAIRAISMMYIKIVISPSLYSVIEQVMVGRLWDNPDYFQPAAVT
jgi:hypothetical protein